MAEERVERRLTAILAADVAGYSRLMAADEEGTLAALKTLRREVADPKIKEHRGRIVNTTGDVSASASWSAAPAPARRSASRCHGYKAAGLCAA
jgi:class 3 adenylate cyclase